MENKESKTTYDGMISDELLHEYIKRIYAGIPYGIKANLGGETQLTVTLFGVSIKENERKREYLRYENDYNLSLADAFGIVYRGVDNQREFGKVVCDANNFVYPLITYYRNVATDEWTNDVVKPYLRPIASMTEAEKAEFNSLPKGYTADISGDRIMIPMYVDWLNAHHFDYSGLIEKGLALETPTDLYEL